MTMTPPAQPISVHAAVTIAADAHGSLFALREDGAVFVLMRKGGLQGDGTLVTDPYWAVCPAVPGTLAAFEQAG